MSSYQQLQERSIDELKNSYDQHAKNVSVGLDFYREEIARREAHEMNLRMLEMTKHMRNMTIAISILTFVNVVIVAVPFILKI